MIQRFDAIVGDASSFLKFSVRSVPSALKPYQSLSVSLCGAGAVIGVWGAAYRRRMRVIDPANDSVSESGPWIQVSRLGNPLVNEVVVPVGKKDTWNARQPSGDAAFLPNYEHPELSALLPVVPIAYYGLLDCT